AARLLDDRRRDLLWLEPRDPRGCARRDGARRPQGPRPRRGGRRRVPRAAVATADGAGQPGRRGAGRRGGAAAAAVPHTRGAGPRRRPGGRRRRRPALGARRRRPAAGGTGMIWAAVLVTCVGCYLLKLAGLSVPARVLASSRVRSVAALMPVALL